MSNAPATPGKNGARVQQELTENQRHAEKETDHHFPPGETCDVVAGEK